MKALLRRAWYTVFPAHPYAVLGRLLYPLLPWRVARVRGSFFVATSEAFIDRCLRDEINRQYYAQPDAVARAANRQAFWGADVAKDWHDLREANVLVNFDASMKYRTQLVAWIATHAPLRRITTICEVGTGMGQFLLQLREQLAPLLACRFVGFDLNAQCIAVANERSRWPDTVFHAGDVVPYIAEDAPTHSLYLFCGTLEYFTQPELEELFALIARKKPAMIAIADTVNFDLATQFQSKPRGNTAFSHNYVHLLGKHGYAVLEKKLEPINPAIPHYTDVLLLAEAV